MLYLRRRAINHKGNEIMMFQCTEADYKLIVDALDKASRETLGRDRSVLEQAAREVEWDAVDTFHGGIAA